MTATLPRPAAAPARSGVTPNWFAAVMGTGIVATAATSLPVQLPGQRTFTLVVWALAALLLMALAAGTVRGFHRDPVLAHFYGAPAMATLTVGAGALLVGRDAIGLPAALAIAWTLWFAGTAMGLATTIAVPWLHATGHGYRRDEAFGGWLMPVVPPTVSATTGALLLPYVPTPGLHTALVAACWALFGVSVAASLVIIPFIGWRLVRGPALGAAMVPTLVIVLGPLGQSVTAANLLDAGLGVAYGVPVWTAALVCAAIAGRMVLRTARTGLPFAPTWWSFTFPVGTVVTASSGLWKNTGGVVFAVAAVVLYLALVVAWVAVGARSLALVTRRPAPAR